MKDVWSFASHGSWPCLIETLELGFRVYQHTGRRSYWSKPTYVSCWYSFQPTEQTLMTTTKSHCLFQTSAWNTLFNSNFCWKMLTHNPLVDHNFSCETRHFFHSWTTKNSNSPTKSSSPSLRRRPWASVRICCRRGQWWSCRSSVTRCGWMRMEWCRSLYYPLVN